jgi:hypothetical protein
VVRDGEDVLEAALPAHLRSDAPLIRSFLHRVAGGYERVGDNALRLIDPRVSGAAGFEFFALLLSGAPGGERQLGTMTFMHQALPLQQHLERLDRDARKVVIVLSDAFELGRGVREKILDYRIRLDALVVPIYLGELRKAHRAGRIETLFMDCVADFQAVPDLYAASGPLTDPTQFFGMRQVLDELVAELEEPRRIAVIHGLPGSGKSSLVRMADYGMTSARFIRVPCAAIAPAAMVTKISGALGGTGGSLQELANAARTARSAAADSRLVLVLDNADAWFDGPGEHATDHGGMREVWDVLIELVRDQVMSTVATTVRGFALGQRVRQGRSNPLTEYVHLIEVPRLERQTAARLVRDLGAQMNVTATERVVAECAALSGGNVDVLRRLCSDMLKHHRREATHHALRSVELTRRDLQTPAADLVAMHSTFEGLLPWLSATEQRVLHRVAVSRPRDAADVAAKELDVAHASAALEDLRLMGLVERIDSREQVAIPLLASWSKQHLGDRSRVSSRWFGWMR